MIIIQKAITLLRIFYLLIAYFGSSKLQDSVLLCYKINRHRPDSGSRISRMGLKNYELFNDPAK